jgi:integrase
VAVLALAGTRIGEALALRWSDVDFDGGFLRVGAQLSRGRERERVNAKTRSAVREVVLVPQLATLLRAHKLASPHSAPADYLFPAPGGRGTDQRVAARAIKAAVTRRSSARGSRRTRSGMATARC